MVLKMAKCAPAAKSKKKLNISSPFILKTHINFFFIKLTFRISKYIEINHSLFKKRNLANDDTP